MMTHASADADYQQLLDVLRAARTLTGLSQAQVAARMEWSPTKMTRIEAGLAGISANDLLALLQLYGIKDLARYPGLLDLARSGRKPGGAVTMAVATRVSARRLAAEFIRQGMEGTEMWRHTPNGTVEEADALEEALLAIVERLRSATGR